MVLTWIEPIDQFVLHRVTMVLCVGVSLWVVVDNLRVYVYLDKHILWLKFACVFWHSVLLVDFIELLDGFV